MTPRPPIPPPPAPPRHAAQGGSAAAAAARAPRTSLATLLSQHVLGEGELVLLILKPSRWFILLSSLRFAAVVLILMCAAMLLQERHSVRFVETALVVLAGRFAWAVLQWMGRLYILTDLRVVAISGVFNAEIYDCPLRRVARTRLVRGIGERLLRIGSIEIVSSEESCPAGNWLMVPRPVEVHEQIVAAVNRAKHNGLGCTHAA